jgi:hypothetical protein
MSWTMGTEGKKKGGKKEKKQRVGITCAESQLWYFPSGNDKYWQSILQVLSSAPASVGRVDNISTIIVSLKVVLPIIVQSLFMQYPEQASNTLLALAK